MVEVNILELIRRIRERDYERAVRGGWVKPYMKPTMINAETNDE